MLPYCPVQSKVAAEQEQLSVLVEPRHAFQCNWLCPWMPCQGHSRGVWGGDTGNCQGKYSENSKCHLTTVESFHVLFPAKKCLKVRQKLGTRKIFKKLKNLKNLKFLKI